MTNHIRCRIEDQSHYIEASLLASLVLRILDDQRHGYAIENGIRFLTDIGRVRENRAAWINAFGFSPTSADAVELVFSQATPPAALKSMLSRAVLSRPPIQRIGVGHLLVGSSGLPDANALARMAALQTAIRCLPRMRDDLIRREDGWKYVGQLGKRMMFWRDPAVFNLVACGAKGWIQWIGEEFGMEEKEDIHLGHWQIFRLKPLNLFFVAGDADQVVNTYPRVSSTFQTFDLDTMSGTTERGRRYFLHGEGGHGLHLHTAGTLNGWLKLNGYTEHQIEPATPEDVDAALNQRGPTP